MLKKGILPARIGFLTLGGVLTLGEILVLSDGELVTGRLLNGVESLTLTIDVGFNNLKDENGQLN